MSKAIKLAFTTVKAMQVEGARIGAVLKGTQSDMHALHVSIIAHLAKHKQIGVLNHYWAQIKDAEGVRRNAVVQWFGKFGTATFDEANQTFIYDGDKSVKLADGHDTPFWKLKGMENSGDVQALDVAGELARLYKRLKAQHDKDVKEGKANPKNAELLSAMLMMQSGVIPTEVRKPKAFDMASVTETPEVSPLA